MYAIAEVYETDVGKVRVEQRATVISEHGEFEGKLQGTVDYIGIQKRSRFVSFNLPILPRCFSFWLMFSG